MVQSTACTQGDGFGVQNQVLNGPKRNASEHPHYLWASDEVFLIASTSEERRHATGPNATSCLIGTLVRTSVSGRCYVMKEAIRKSNILRR